MKFTIIESYEIIKGFKTLTYELEAESEEEAIELINNQEIEPLSEEEYIEDTEFIERSIVNTY